MGSKGIRLVAVAPGSFPTPTATLQLSAGAELFDPGLGVPLLRGGEHAELTNLCAFLVSDLSGYINGETVVIDGGQRYLGGARATSGAMLKWTERDWDQQRENSRGEAHNSLRCDGYGRSNAAPSSGRNGFSI
jgi:hypothetical protein